MFSILLPLRLYNSHVLYILPHSALRCFPKSLRMAASLPYQPSPATISAAVVPGSQTCHIPDAIPAKKAALLIGICDKVLKGPHTDVKMMQELLVGKNSIGLRLVRGEAYLSQCVADVYGYTPKNVTVLLDDEQDGHIQPTKDNIVR